MPHVPGHIQFDIGRPELWSGGPSGPFSLQEPSWLLPWPGLPRPGVGGQTLPRPPFLRYVEGQPVRPFAPPGLGYVPSIQRLRNLAPSEQAGLGGYYEDELGLSAPDVFWLSNRLRPRLSLFGTAPRWLAR